MVQRKFICQLIALEQQFGELRERMAKIEGLLEGLRKVATGWTAKG